MKQLDRPWKRLKWARIAAGFEHASNFAVAAEVSQQSHHKHEQAPKSEGGKGSEYREVIARKYAKTLQNNGLEATWQWLKYNTGPPPIEVIRALMDHGEIPEDEAQKHINGLAETTQDRLTSQPQPELHGVDTVKFDTIASAVRRRAMEMGRRFHPGKELETCLYIYGLDQRSAHALPFDVRYYDAAIRLGSLPDDPKESTKEGNGGNGDPPRKKFHVKQR